MANDDVKLPSSGGSKRAASDVQETPVRDANRLPDPPDALYGWRLHVGILGAVLGLFLATLETTIVATSLPTIAESLNDSTRISWVVTSYLLTYSGLILFFSKMSDIFGYREVLILSLIIFTISSGLCASSKTMTQLIIFRAFQGVGGSGIFSLAFVTTVQICPVKWLGIYSGATMTLFALANILGPLVGGALSDNGTWWWIFMLNVPPAPIAAILLFISLPPHKSSTRSIKTTLARVDYIGAFLSIAGAILLIYALQTGGTTYKWSSAIILSTLLSGATAVLLFFKHEHHLSRGTSTTAREPLFPLRRLRNAVLTCVLLSAFFLGGTFYALTITLPQRAQLVSAASATAAGVRLLPMMLLSSLASALAGVAYARFSTALALPALVAGGALLALGAALMVALPTDGGDLAFPVAQYGFEAVAGVGVGLMVPTALVLVRVEVVAANNAVAMGALNMLRTMGGAVALAVLAAVMNEELPRRLAEKELPAAVVEGLMGDPVGGVGRLGREERGLVAGAYAEVYRTDFAVVAGMAGLAFEFAVAALVAKRIRGVRKEEVVAEEV